MAEQEAQTPEEIEEKKARMREYMAADRKLDRMKEKQQKRRGRPGCGGGCLMSLLKLTLLASAFAGVGYLIWLWHPWGTEIVESPAEEHPGACPEGASGTHTVEYFTLFGARLYESGGATFCVE